VANDIHTQVATGSIVGSEALVAFVGNVGTTDAYLLPVRLATVLSAEFIADALVVRFITGAFPELSAWPHDGLTLETRGKTDLAQISAGYQGNYFAASGRCDGLTITAAGNATTDWNQVTSRLATLKTFSDSFFVRTSLVMSDSAPTLVGLKAGVAHLSSRHTVVLRCWFYRGKYVPSARDISVESDQSVISLSSDSSYEINSRYDEVEFWLHPQRLAADSRTMVSLRLPGDPTATGDLTTRIQIPMVVRKPVTPRLLRGITAAAGASLIAAPALMGAGTSLSLRIALAVLGALIVSIVAALNSPA